MTGLLERLGVELPIVQAGMGGGISRHELAAAVSEAGALGTLGILPAPILAEELAAARRLTGKPIAVNLLLPFAHRAHRRVAAQADLVVTFWGRPRRPARKPWLHQCGSVAEALAARAAGADGVVVQGMEAGGHVRGELDGFELLERTRASLPDPYPVLLAGGMVDAADVRGALAAGASSAVLGTRFLLSTESRAHLEYKRRLLDGKATILTELFGLGWPARHRVLPNRATERWASRDDRGPTWVRVLNRGLSPLARRLPERAQEAMLSRQSPALPLFSPRPPTDDGPDGLLDSGPLYAGETVARIDRIEPASRIVADLAP